MGLDRTRYGHLSFKPEHFIVKKEFISAVCNAVNDHSCSFLQKTVTAILFKTTIYETFN